jgi:hypothetical protein
MRFPCFLDNWLADGEVVSLRHWPCFTPQKDFWYLFLLEAKAQLEGLGKLKDILACSIVPESTLLPHAISVMCLFFSNNGLCLPLSLLSDVACRHSIAIISLSSANEINEPDSILQG